MDYVFSRSHSSPWSDKFWSVQHVHVVCMSQLTCLVEEMIEMRFLGSWIWIANHPPVLKLPYDKKTLAQVEAWCQSCSVHLGHDSRPSVRVFPWESGVLWYRMYIVTCKVIVSMDLLIRSELRVRWQSETLGGVASLQCLGFFWFCGRAENSKKTYKHL